MKKRILSFLLAFVLICLMLPTTAFAADSHTHCICGKTHKNVGDHDAEVSTTFTAVTDQNGLQNAATNGGRVYLANDITINAVITVTGDLTLCLNGKTLKNTATETRVIHINGGTLNLTDCGSTGTITGGNITDRGGGVYNQGTFAMYGGKISGNTANLGGGVYVLGNGFIMYGGEISNNTAKYNGGGVYNSRQNTIIAGGRIINNTANGSPSGGIFMNESIMLSGNPVISGNEYGSNDGSFDIYEISAAIRVAEDFAPIDFPITVSVDPDPIYNGHVFLEAADSGVDIEKYIDFFDYVSEVPLYEKDGKYYAGFAIVEQPTGENNYTVNVSSDKDLSCQWYKKVLGSKVLTVSDMFLMDGEYDPISQSFTMPYGELIGEILLNAGDRLIVSSQSEIYATLTGADAERDGNTYTFTALWTDYYMLRVVDDSGASVTLTKNGSNFVEVEGQTELTLDTSNLENGDYKCKLVWDCGTDDTYDDIEASSEIVTYTKPTYIVTWKNYDGSILETDTGVTHGTMPKYNGATPTKPEDENFTYTFNGWSAALEAVTGNAEYTAQFTAVSKRVDPTYTVTIPAAVNAGESFKVSATGVVLNTDQTLTVTLQSDFKLRNEQNIELAFEINGGDIGNDAVVLSITGNGDKNNPLAKDSDPLTAEVTEEAKYSGTYTGTITFVVAVNTAGNS